jgi:hypothetical protein
MAAEREIPDAEDTEARAALEPFIVDSEDLLALESRIGRFNIFDALKIARAEIRHSNFLAFILDPAESHGQGQLFLKAVLMDLLKAAPPALRPLSPIDLDGIDLRGVEVRREWAHIDLLITCQQPPFLVVIENKVDSQEHSDQLNRYEMEASHQYPGIRPLYVCLTPDADDPSKDNWVPYSYEDLHRVLTRVRTTYHGAIGDDVLVFLDHYLNLIGTRFMDDSEIDALCQRIYKNHRQALDLIFERGKPASGVLAEAARVVLDDPRWHVLNQSAKYIGFVPKSWLEWLPPLGDEKNEPRSWIILRLYLQEKMLEFIVQVRSMKDREKRNKIVQSLITWLPDRGFKKSQGGKGEGGFTRVSGADCILKRSEDKEPEPDSVRTAVKKKLDEVYPKLDGARAFLEPMCNLEYPSG